MPYHLFYKENQHVLMCSNADDIVDKSSLLWCDLYHPEKAEEQWIEGFLGVEVPTREEMDEIEPSSRFYVENDGVYTTISVVTKTDTPEPEIHAISFILLEKGLITLRYSDPYSFTQFSKSMKENADKYQSGTSVAIGLIEEIINRLADIIEFSGHALDTLNRTLFRPAVTDKKLRQHSMPDFEEMLRQIGIQADLLSKVRESLLSAARMIAYINSRVDHSMHADEASRMDILLKDIPALLDQLDSLSSKTGFLLEAALGLVGIQQTAIIKIFSVASVVFLPPTLVASIYGMNFHFMPELDWKMGYPLAITIMVGSAWLPYRFFKKKKWL